jgi:elongator complex protein 4
MSSFKRKSSSKQPPLPTGTRPSPTSSLTVITSTGIPSLDDILGGGLPLSCSLLILNPDPHSAYGELVQKYFIAQGLVCGQKVCVIDDHANELALECMWTPGGADPPPDDEDEDAAPDQDDKITIAWRYKQMKKFQTTVSSSTPYVHYFDLSILNGITDPETLHRSAEEYCRPFDLTARIPHSVVESSRQTDQLVCLDVLGFHGPGEPITSRVIRKLAHMLEADAASSRPLRICIPSFGSPQWGDLGNKVKSKVYPRWRLVFR